ncbi:hypothetical protein SPRA44_10039 [Serratia proteamaculans]|nr:hypothetical protein SPRA44_10039 [Serratia proteamaculans]
MMYISFLSVFRANSDHCLFFTPSKCDEYHYNYPTNVVLLVIYITKIREVRRAKNSVIESI